MNNAPRVNHEPYDMETDWPVIVVDFPHFALPAFENAPVVETVLSVQFARLSAMQSVHLGLFGRKMKTLFPNTEEHPPLPRVTEHFPEPLRSGSRIEVEALERLPLPRLWLLNNEGAEMIQVQNDRFIKNWRKIKESDEYPHYEPVIKPAFKRDFREFQAFVREEQLGILEVDQCEVTYVNHIVSGEGWQELGEAHRIFSFWNGSVTTPPGEPEDCRIHVRFLIRDDKNHPIGRLHVDVEPARSAANNRPMYVMNLTARGQYGANFDFFDIGRQWIVKSFEHLTTENMHRIWRKK